MTSQISQEREDHAEVIKTLQNTKLKRRTDNLTHERIEARNEVKLVWKEKDEATKGGLTLESFSLCSNFPKRMPNHGQEHYSDLSFKRAAHLILFEKKSTLLELPRLLISGKSATYTVFYLKSILKIPPKGQTKSYVMFFSSR